MLNSIKTKHINCENEAKFIQERILLVEKHIAELCSSCSAYSRKAARVRDKGDEIAKAALQYSEAEDINNSLSNGLENFATNMSSLGDYGDMRVQNIDEKVVKELAQYENICKHVKDEVKQIYTARDRELTRRKQLDRIKERNPRNRQQILQAETDLVKATTEVSKTIHSLEEQITTFERQKLHDIKFIFLDFISGEMGYHAKALELLTKAYQDILSIDEEADLEDFKKTLRQPESVPHVNRKSGLFRTAHSLGSISNLFSTPKKRLPKTSQGLQKSTKRLSKSEEVLDSPRTQTEESDNSDIDSPDENSNENSIEVVEKNRVSQFTARRYLK